MSNIGLDYEDWQAAIVAGVDGGTARLVFASGKTGDLPRGNATMPVRGKGGTAFAALKPGDIIAVAPSGSAWSLRSIPAVSGGMIVEQPDTRSEEHTSELQSLMRSSYAVFCWKKKKYNYDSTHYK